MFIVIHIEGQQSDQALMLWPQDNILTISGEKKSESQEENKNKNYFRTERSYGSFTRSFTLPSEINQDSVDAQFDNGVLKVKIDREKPKAIKEKRIEIK